MDAQCDKLAAIVGECCFASLANRFHQASTFAQNTNRRDASGRRVVVNFSMTEIDGQENRGAIFLLAESGDTRASEFV